MKKKRKKNDNGQKRKHALDQEKKKKHFFSCLFSWSLSWSRACFLSFFLTFFFFFYKFPPQDRVHPRRVDRCDSRPDSFVAARHLSEDLGGKPGVEGRQDNIYLVDVKSPFMTRIWGTHFYSALDDSFNLRKCKNGWKHLDCFFDSLLNYLSIYFWAENLNSPLDVFCLVDWWLVKLVTSLALWPCTKVHGICITFFYR